MTAHSLAPVLIVGGSGVVGAQAAHALRRLHPGLPIAIGGRDLAKARTVADAVGGASAVRIDLQRADLGLAADAPYSAVIVFVKDAGLNTLKYAQAHGLPYLSTSSGSFEIAPEVAHYIRSPTAAPILLASHWLAGAATLPALLYAREFARIERIDLSALLDEEDMGGPAAAADYERLITAAGAQVMEDGQWRWLRGDEAARTIRSVDGVEVQGAAYSPLDVVSLSAATGARSIRLDMALGVSASRRRGEAYSTEIAIEIEGEGHDGLPLRVRHELVQPAGQAPLTALSIALGIERLLGLAGGDAVAPGLYFPDSLIAPEYYLQRLQENGLRVRRAAPALAESEQ